jgi:hypothetical protein
MAAAGAASDLAGKAHSAATELRADMRDNKAQPWRWGDEEWTRVTRSAALTASVRAWLARSAPSADVPAPGETGSVRATVRCHSRSSSKAGPDVAALARADTGEAAASQVVQCAAQEARAECGAGRRVADAAEEATAHRVARTKVARDALGAARRRCVPSFSEK